MDNRSVSSLSLSPFQMLCFHHFHCHSSCRWSLLSLPARPSNHPDLGPQAEKGSTDRNIPQGQITEAYLNKVYGSPHWAQYPSLSAPTLCQVMVSHYIAHISMSFSLPQLNHAFLFHFQLFLFLSQHQICGKHHQTVHPESLFHLSLSLSHMISMALPSMRRSWTGLPCASSA